MSHAPLVVAAFVSVFALACASSATQTPPGTSAGAAGEGAPDDGGTCPPMEHVCACQGGHYCLAANAMCMAPTAPCPPAAADAGAAP